MIARRDPKVVEWTIRKALPEDADPLSRCIEAAYAPYQSRIPDLPAVSEGLGNDIRDNLVFVAEIERQILGGLVLVIEPNDALLANIAVSPKASGLGIGRALIARAEAECLARNIGVLRLSTHKDMPENIVFYERLGWTVSRTSDNKTHMKKAL